MAINKDNFTLKAISQMSYLLGGSAGFYFLWERNWTKAVFFGMCWSTVFVVLHKFEDLLLLIIENTEHK